MRFTKQNTYLLDQNCVAAIGQSVPSNFINVQDAMKVEGIKAIKGSFHDSVILEVAIKHNYIIITKDKGLAVRTILKNRDIIFSDFEGLHLLKGSKTKHIMKIEDLI